MKLTEELITELVESISIGLSNIEAAAISGIDNSTFYRWLRLAEEAEDKPASKISKHARLCKQFKAAVDKAKLERKKRWIQKLEACKSPSGIIFLLKQNYPDEYNKEPVPIPNFQKLEEFMRSEYTQHEIEAIREAVRAAETRRQKGIRYDEDELFGDSNETTDRSL